MSFLFSHHAPSHPEYSGPPQPPAPWVAEFDGQSQRWYFINRETGERTYNFPQNNQGYSDGYGGQQQAPSHAGRNTALAALGGLAGGALLMHEGHKVEEHWDEDKERFDYDRDRVEDRVDYDRDRVEDRVDYDRQRFDDRVQYDENRVEDFPEDAAQWTGSKVQEVEDIPEDVAGWTGRKVEEVEDIPDDVAGWAGRRVQGVEDFGDKIEDSYDDVQGAYENGKDDRYADDNENDRW